jgi:hypothetical protein
MTVAIEKTPEGALILDYADLVNDSNLDAALEVRLHPLLCHDL